MLLISGASFWTPEGGCFDGSGHFEPARAAAYLGGREKAALLAEIDAEGGKVRLVARRHGISESLLYNWRSARKAAAAALGAAENVEFIAIGLVGGKPPPGPALLSAPNSEPLADIPAVQGKTGSIEIALSNGARINVDAFVNEKALSRVLRAMKGLT
jgi:transposase